MARRSSHFLALLAAGDRSYVPGGGSSSDSGLGETPGSLRSSPDLNDGPRSRAHPGVNGKPMPSSLDLRTLAALITASVAVAIVVAGEPAALAGPALVLAGAMAVSLAWRP